MTHNIRIKVLYKVEFVLQVYMYFSLTLSLLQGEWVACIWIQNVQVIWQTYNFKGLKKGSKLNIVVLPQSWDKA